ncbi:fungal-specific transcription factor domain-containing protein [Biscogniauxia sp. FL1348]|nr:fungal-specific transcription factor domain-containing protein [Biscogniauxia sp. FL1348]
MLVPCYGMTLTGCAQQCKQERPVTLTSLASTVIERHWIGSTTLHNRTPPPPPAFVGSADLPTGSAVGAGSISSQASHQREQMRAKRRVPQSQRRRAQMSCDGCKTKRCKCVRLWPGHGPGDEGAASGATTTSDELPPCKLCTETGISCVTSMPRKHRVYGSVEDLDKRYRALEALVTGVFPGLNTQSTAEELVAFGRGMGVNMPEFPQTPDTAMITQATTTATLTSAKRLTATLTAPVTSTPGTDQKPSNPEIILARAAYLDKELPRAYTAKGNSSRDMKALPRPANEALLGSEDERTGLVLDPSGWPHYVGPCGSFTFFTDIKELAARQSAATAVKAGKQTAGRQHQPVGAGAAGSSLAGSLGKIRYGRPAGPGLSQTQSPMPRQGYLEGDSPPILAEGGGGGPASSSPSEHPDDLDYRRYRRAVSTIALPPRDQADACMDAYFRHVHPNFILFHRGAFQRAYGALWRSREATASTTAGGLDARADVGEVSVSAGWLCCLYMMLVFGSRSLPQDGTSLAFQRRWFAEVDRLPPLSTSSLPNVCAYMLLSLYHHNANDRTSAWTFHGAACRLAVAQGMHREKVARSFGDPTHENLRRRIWWTVYQYEQFLCCSLGRPSAIDDREMDVGVPDDDFLEGNLLPADHLRYAVKLDMLHAAIRREIYDPVTNSSSSNSKKCARALEFLLALVAWEEALPRRLRPVPAAHGLDGNENQWRSVHLLHIRQQDTLNFLTRPFLLRAVQRSQSQSQSRFDDAQGDADAAIVARLGEVCVTTAMRCGESITELFRAGFLNGVTWLDVFFAYLSSVTISLALLPPPPLSPSPPPPEHDRERERESESPLFFGLAGAGAGARARAAATMSSRARARPPLPLPLPLPPPSRWSRGPG